MVSIFFFLIQLLCLLLCRDLERMKNFLSLLLPFFQTKFSFCHLYHKSFFFLICSRWSVTDIAKVLPLISMKSVHIEAWSEFYIWFHWFCDLFFDHVAFIHLLQSLFSVRSVLYIFVSDYILKCSWIFIFFTEISEYMLNSFKKPIIIMIGVKLVIRR